ncbi:DUF4906 domain-containing protein [Alistipes finegoldii]|uniref:DUF4906 domain-containing protein n=2 Tax=Alistipes finegoldii TaxID=214856 RepID=UPI0024B1B132|nr:DUF4906 domain-containing protein [Alistipes finegoldii]
MNQFRKYVWIALAVLAAGCSESDREDGNSVSGGVSGTESPLPEGMVPATLDLSSNGRLTLVAGDQAATRAASPDETAVGDLWMLQFDTEASAEGSLVHRAYIPAQEIVQSGMAVTASVMLRESASCVIVVVANAPESFTVSTLPAGTKLTELRARTFAVSSTTGASLPSDASVRLPMFGETEQIAVSLVGSQSVSVKLTRLVSRMRLSLVNSFTSGYPLLELTGVTLRNAPTKIAYGPLTEHTAYLGDVYPEASADNFRDYDPVTTGLAGSETSYVWYIAPNRRGKGTATKAEDKSALTAPEGQGSYCTYVSIRGKVFHSAVSSGRDVVYNVYLGANNIDDYNLWANAAYSARLTVTGFNDDQLEVGYDGFGITVGPLEGIADNTITGWHPDTGLDYIPKFLSFTPERIDFGDAESPEAQKVAFRINSKWRFSYTSGDRTKVIASSSAAANTDQTGGGQDEPADCEVTFTPVVYKAQSGTPVAGTRYNAVATFSTVGGSITATRTTLFLRTVPTFYGEPAVTPAPGNIPRAGTTVKATLSSNAAWNLAATPGTSASQQADVYASRSLEVSVPSNETWSTRTVKVMAQYGENTKEWSYTQPGMSIDGITILPNPGDGIPGGGATYTVRATGDCGMVPVRALSDGEELARTYASSDKPGELKVPVNGSHTDRIVVFQYQENGVWKNFDRGMQAPGYSITSATVTPAGDIPGSGGRYTVTLSGLLPAEGVEIRASVDGSTIVAGKVTASGRGETLSIPANDGDSERTVAIEYLWNGTWTTIESRTQLSEPRITTATVSPAGNIPYGGGDYTVTLTGVLPEGGVQVRAFSGGTLVQATVVSSGASAVLSLPANSSLSNRTVAFQYLWNGTWTNIENRTQLPTPQITSSTVSPSGDIPYTGGTYTVTLNGALPAEGVEVRATSGGTTLGTGLATKAGTGATLTVPVNSGSTSRNVVFEYKWNGVWTVMDDRMQWPTPSVTSATVSPVGNIPGEGGNYTVTINGVMPQGGIPVRAYAGGSAIASGTVTASGRGVTLNIPANSLTANRTVAFQYQWNGTWTTIENRTQVPKPNITLASVSPAGNIPYGGGVYTVTLSGVLPSGGVQVRAITNTVLASGVVTGSGSTCTLTIPANTTVSNRTVTFQYLWNGTWTRIDGRTQLPTPQITKAALSPEGIISGVGEDMYITLWGAIPMNGVNIRARVGTTVVASNVVTGTGKQNAKVLSIPENEGKARDITFEYQFDNRWINIETRQQRGNLILVEFAERVTAPDVKGKCDAKTGYHFMSDEEIDQLWARASEFIVINAENTTEKYGIHTGHYDGYDSFTIHGGGRYGVLLSRRRTFADKCNYVCVKDY